MNYLTDSRNITVYQLVQYVNTTYGTRIEHNKVMSRQMPKLLAAEGFGVATQIVETLANKYAPSITTYTLTPQQCVITAAVICVKYLIQVIDRLDVLERAHEPNYISKDILAKAMYAYQNRRVPLLNGYSRLIIAPYPGATIHQQGAYFTNNHYFSLVETRGLTNVNFASTNIYHDVDGLHPDIQFAPGEVDEVLTVYRLVDTINAMFGLQIRHNKVMSLKMPRLLAATDFGGVSQYVETVSRGNMGATQEVATYALTKRQCVIVGAHMCKQYLIQLMNRLHYLETTYYENVTQHELVEQLKLTTT